MRGYKPGFAQLQEDLSTFFYSEIVGAVLYSDSKAEAKLGKNTEDLAKLNYRLKIG